jgi:hypothetical protein
MTDRQWRWIEKEPMNVIVGHEKPSDMQWRQVGFKDNNNTQSIMDPWSNTIILKSWYGVSEWKERQNRLGKLLEKKVSEAS